MLSPTRNLLSYLLGEKHGSYIRHTHTNTHTDTTLYLSTKTSIHSLQRYRPLSPFLQLLQGWKWYFWCGNCERVKTIGTNLHPHTHRHTDIQTYTDTYSFHYGPVHSINHSTMCGTLWLPVDNAAQKNVYSNGLRPRRASVGSAVWRNVASNIAKTFVRSSRRR